MVRFRRFLLRLVEPWLEGQIRSLVEQVENVERRLANKVNTQEEELKGRFAWLEKKLEQRTEQKVDSWQKELSDDHERFRKELVSTILPLQQLAKEAMSRHIDLAVKVGTLEATTHRVQYVPANMVEEVKRQQSIDPVDASAALVNNLKQTIQLQEALNRAQSLDEMPDFLG